ncbi:MAG: hypothetical protein BIFFINMI_01881 [Phycisphaerae bacterium]|nr:hypothetical protein [Phycisphaerae bacterium]
MRNLAVIVPCLFLGAPATGVAQDDSLPASLRIQARPGLDGRWAVGRWAPLRLVFHDPGELRGIELFCEAGGPTFRADALPAPTGESYIDLAVYAQLGSDEWTVRLTRPGGAVQLVSLRLGVQFGAGRLGEITPQRERDWMRGPTAENEMALAAGDGASIASDLLATSKMAAQYLATGRTLTVTSPTTQPTDLSLAQTFGGQGLGGGLADEHVYRGLWGEGAADPPALWQQMPLAVLAGAGLGVLATGLLLRRRPAWAAAAALVVMAAAGAGLWRWQAGRGGLLQVRMEIVTRPGDAGGRRWVPLRRQSAIAVAARRGGRCAVADLEPTAQPVAALLSERLDGVLLPARWRTSADGATGAVVDLPRGDRRLLVSTWCDATGGQVELDEGRAEDDKAIRAVAWRGLPVTLESAWLVEGDQAWPIGRIAGRDGRAPLGDAAVSWPTVYTAQAGAGEADRLAHRLMEHWSRWTVGRATRRWLIGWESPSPAGGLAADPRQPPPAVERGGVLHLPTLWAIDLGPLPEADDGPFRQGLPQRSQ